MTLTIELSPEMEQQLHEEAAPTGQEATTLARALLEKQLALARRERARRVAALLDQWDAEDTAAPDPEPPPLVSPLSLREVRVD
jgi:hypothetical protein